MYMDLQRNGPDDAKRYYFPGTFNKEDATKIKVDLGREITGLTFNLPGDFQLRTIEGRVVWRNGRPASDVEVNLLCPRATLPGGYAIEFGPTSVQTDKLGRFKLEAFSGTTYWLEARGSRGRLHFHSPEKKLYATGEVKNLRLVLSEQSPTTDCKEN